MVHWLILKFFSLSISLSLAFFRVCRFRAYDINFMNRTTLQMEGVEETEESKVVVKKVKKYVRFQKFSLCTWHSPTENCPNSGICRRISSVTKWTPLCWGLKLILRWNQAEPICIPLLAPRWLELDAIAIELNYRSFGRSIKIFRFYAVFFFFFSSFSFRWFFSCSPFRISYSKKSFFFFFLSRSHFLRVLSLYLSHSLFL